MRFVSFTGWATRQSRKSQQRFVRQFLVYAETHWQEYDVLQKDLSNFDVALGLLVRQQSAAQTAEMIRALSSFWLARGYWQEALNYCDLVEPLLNGWRSGHVNNQQVELGWAGVRLVAVAAQFQQGLQQEARATLQHLLDELHMEDEAISLLLLLFASLVDHMKGQTVELDGLYDKWLTRIRKIDDLSIRGSVLDLVARQLADQGEIERSIELLREKVNIDSQRQDINAIGETLRSLASVAAAAGLAEVADDCLQDAVRISGTYGKTDAYVEALNERAAIALKQENYPLAADLYDQILVIARQRKDKPAIADALRFLSFAVDELRQDNGGLLEESLSISREIGDYAGMVRSWIQLGTLAQERKNLDKAQSQFEQARDLAERIQDQALLATAWQSLGELAEEQAHWTEAHHCYDQCLTVLKHVKNQETQALVLRSQGHVLIELQDVDLAVNAFNASADISAQIEDWESYAASLYDLAYAAALNGYAEEMHELSRRCVEVLRQVGSTQLGEIDEAIAHLEQILASSPKHDQLAWQKLGHYQQQEPGA